MIIKSLVAAVLWGLLVASAGACAAAAQPSSGPFEVKVIDDGATLKREADDLRAQEVAAWWTRFAALMSVPALGLSGFGLFIVLDQLKAARRQLAASDEATREARKSADAASAAARVALLSTRPWIKMEVIGLRYDRRNGPPHLVLSVRATNVGQTPALHVDVLVNYVGPLKDHTTQRDLMGLEHWTEVMREFPVLVGRPTVFQGEGSTMSCAVNIPSEDVEAEGWQVDVAVTYAMAGDEHAFIVAERFIMVPRLNGLLGQKRDQSIQTLQVAHDDTEKRIHT